MRTLVVGASLAGLRSVEALRRRDSSMQIVMVGDETQLPYDRPRLSKDLLLGLAEPDDLQLTTAARLDDLGVEARLGTAAAALDLQAHTVTLDDGAVVGYEKLVVATGSAATRLPSADREGVHVLRTLQDAIALRTAFTSCPRPRVAVIGGGVIGSEVASAARQLGLDVTIIDVLPVLMQRVLGDVLGRRMARLHRQHGVALRLGASVAGLLGEDRVEGVVLADRTVVPADIVVVGVGATPNVGWLKSSGLLLQDGVVCDEYLAAAPDVYAVGDVARWRHARYQQLVRTEHWTGAVEHAEAVAATLTGTPTTIDSIPYVWTDQYGLKLQIAGRLQAEDEIVFLLDQADPLKWLGVAGSHGAQHAVVALSAPAAFIRHKQRMTHGQPTWPPAHR